MKKRIVDFIKKTEFEILFEQRQKMDDSNSISKYDFLNIKEEISKRYSVYLSDFIEMIIETSDLIEVEINNNIKAFLDMDFCFEVSNMNYRKIDLKNKNSIIDEKNKIQINGNKYFINKDHLIYVNAKTYLSPIELDQQSMVMFESYVIEKMTTSELNRYLKQNPEIFEKYKLALKEYEQLSKIISNFEDNLIANNLDDNFQRPIVTFDLSSDNSKKLEEMKTFISLVCDLSFDYSYAYASDNNFDPLRRKIKN